MEHAAGTSGSISGGTITIHGDGLGIRTNGGTFNTIINWGNPTGTKIGIQNGGTPGLVTNYGNISFAGLGAGVGHGIINAGGNVSNRADITISNINGGNTGVYGNDVSHGATDATDKTISISGYSGNHGMHGTGAATLEYGTITVGGLNSDAVRAGTTATIQGGTASVSGNNSNGVYGAGGGSATTTGVIINAANANVSISSNSGTNSNAVNALAKGITVNNSANTVTVSHSGSSSNGLYAQAGDITINGSNDVTINSKIGRAHV